MKKPVFILPFLLLLNTILIISTSAQQPAPVFYTDRNPVLTAARYNILPVFRGRGGGLTLTSADNDSCPLFVAQEQLELKSGLPVTFTPATPSKGVVRVSTDLNVKFRAATVCVQSTVWKLEHDGGIGQYFVVSGGMEGKPGPQTIDNWFKIDKYDEENYKLVFCPTVCKYCKVICKDVGIFFENGKRRLALSDEPFPVMFKKA